MKGVTIRAKLVELLKEKPGGNLQYLEIMVSYLHMTPKT